MGDVIQLAGNTTGLSPVFLIWDYAGKVWQHTTNTFVAYVTANRANYEIAMVEEDVASEKYHGDFDSDVAAGDYNVEIREAAGEGSVLASTISPLEWDGSDIIERAIAGLTTQAKSDVNDEAQIALADIHLDHLMAVAVTGADVVDNSVVAYIASKSATADWDTFDNTTDSLQAISDEATLGASDIADAVWDAVRASHTNVGSFGEGVLLSANGLNNIDTTDSAGVPGNFRERLNWLYARMAFRSVMTTADFTVYKDDGISILTNQLLTDTGTTQEQSEIT